MELSEFFREYTPDRYGGLYLRNTAITSLPEGLTVGGYLYLRGTAITSLPEGLTVGGYLDLSGTNISEEEASRVRSSASECAFIWIDGKYILADGVFSEVIARRGNIRRIRKIGSSTCSTLSPTVMAAGHMGIH